MVTHLQFYVAGCKGVAGSTVKDYFYLILAKISAIKIQV